MKFKIKPLALGIACAGLLTIHGCGGGGGGGGGVADLTTVSGIAATGAAFEGATVDVTDSSGNTVGTSPVVGKDGVFSIVLKAGAKAPFVLTATRPGADGDSESLVSVIASVTGITATANITPITHLIAARLSTSGDPSKLGAELKGDQNLLTPEKVKDKVTEVQKILEPILTATDTTSNDPLTGSFTVNGKGYDRLLDSIKISVIPASTTASNIEISIKQQQDDDAQPVAIQFSNKDDPATQGKTLPKIDQTKLVAEGTADLITSFLAQLTSCYALPLATRVNSTISKNLATGIAVNVVAPACKTAFLGDNPDSFLSNGNVVGRDGSGNGGFNSLFKEGATNLVFSQGSYEFTRKNGDIVAGYKSKDSAGNETYDTFVLRKDTDDKLKLVGNKYVYGGGVSAYQQIRTFAKDASSTYFSTGYAIKVPLINGVDYVTIKTPTDKLLTLIRGSDGMDFPKLNTLRQPVQSNGSPTSTPSAMVPSGTSFVRIRSEYASANPNLKHPAERDTGLFFTETDAEEIDISGYGNQSLWVIKYYDSSKKELATQSYKTRARANTIAEMRTRAWAKLDTDGLSYLTTNFVDNTATAPGNNSYTKLPTSGLLTPTWDVPSGALPPTEVKVYGKAGPNADGGGTKVQFNDGQSVGSTKRTIAISCVNGTGSGEKHCVTDASGTGIGYTTNAIMTGLHLWARDTSGREYVNFYATYKLN